MDANLPSSSFLYLPSSFRATNYEKEKIPWRRATEKPGAHHGSMEEQRRVGRMAAELTFWTLCPYCYYMHEYEKTYEECCLRCANCRRGFHAAAIRAPPEAEAFDGGGVEEQNGLGVRGHYKCRLGLFPLKYEWGAMERGGEGEEEEKIDVGDYLVEISSSSEEEGWKREANANVGGEGEERKKMDVEEESGGVLEFDYQGDDILVSA